MSTGYRATLESIADLSPLSPLLLVYLHSPLHSGSAPFASGTLGDASASRYLSGEDLIRCYGASVHSADGSHLSSTLGAGSYPYVALLQVKGSSGGGGRGGAENGRTTGLRNVTVEMLLKMEGAALTALSPRQFLAYIQTCVRAHREVLAEAEAHRLQREEEAHLRDEQDREYRDALEADRKREAERKAEREKKENEERRIAEAEIETERKKARRIEGARARAGTEPAHIPGKTAQIRLTLPSGKRVDRRFGLDDSVGTVRAFLIVHFHENGIPIENFSLSTSYPRKAYEDDNMTLEEAGLFPQAVLLIHNLDA